MKKAELEARAATAGKAALGLAAASAAAYGLYVVGGARARRTPVTELSSALRLPLHYVPWRDGYYAYCARRGSGRPLVFLHSINAAASAHEMQPLVERLGRETQRPLFALEWLGFGHSDRPDLAYTPELLEDQLEHWLGRVVRPRGGADVVALSLGANYAAEVARYRPELVRSLVAIEPAGLGGEPSRIGRVWGRLLFTLPGVQRAFYDRLTTRDALERFARENLFSPGFALPEEWIAPGAETARVEGASRPLDDFLSGRLFPAAADQSFLRMRQPLLVAIGTNEDRRQESYEQLPELEARGNVTVVRYPTGALPHWERPEEVAGRILTFLEDVVPAARGA